MERCHRYLHDRNPAAAKQAKAVIRERSAVPARSPRLGRPYEKDRSLRELVIRFGRRGRYLALYRYDPENDVVRILAFKHGQEEGYK